MRGYVHGGIFNDFYKLLQRRVRENIPDQPLVFHDWMTLITGALIGASLARFGFEPWEPDRKSFMGPISTAGSLGETMMENRARSISDAQSFFKVEATLALDRQEIFDSSVNYAKRIIAEQTPKERESYGVICRRMSGCTTRPEGEGHLPYDVQWCTIARDDDWWHARRLLQMLVFRYSLPEQTHCKIERQLIMLLAAIEGGSTEAVLWFIY